MRAAAAVTAAKTSRETQLPLAVDRHTSAPSDEPVSTLRALMLPMPSPGFLSKTLPNALQDSIR